MDAACSFRRCALVARCLTQGAALSLAAPASRDWRSDHELRGQQIRFLPSGAEVGILRQHLALCLLHVPPKADALHQHRTEQHVCMYGSIRALDCAMLLKI